MSHQLPGASGTSSMTHSNSGVPQTSPGVSGAVGTGTGAGQGTGLASGVGARPSQPLTPPQLPNPDAAGQEQVCR